MNRFRNIVRTLEQRSPMLQRILAQLRARQHAPTDAAYAARLAREQEIFQDQEDVNALPQIFHYWSHTYVRPLLEEVGASNPDEFFARFLRESAGRCRAEAPRFLSIGAGNCDTEVRVAQQLERSGLARFTLECLDMNPHMLARGRELAEREGVAQHIVTREGDFNAWRAAQRYHGVMVNQALHHVTDLEGLCAEIARAIAPHAYFITSDMIGRNGHQRWPEALAEVQRFWQELPPAYRFNRQLGRHEEAFENWDCSHEGFEGIRAQDILPLLLERFHMHVFIAFGNVIDPFVDRSFGHNFDGDGEWDRRFIDRVHALDEEGLRSGRLTPTHLMAVMALQPAAAPFHSRGLDPRACVRKPG